MSVYVLSAETPQYLTEISMDTKEEMGIGRTVAGYFIIPFSTMARSTSRKFSIKYGI